MSESAQASFETPEKTRHSKEDALTEREFELLLEGARTLDEPYAEQTRFVLLVCGRLGLRAGELAHLREDWVDWRRRMIQIPRHQQCDKGTDGGICGMCEQQAQQRLEYNPSMSIEEARAQMWSAKTAAAARSVPFDHDSRVEIAVERFFDRWDQWPVSQNGINRRVDWAAEAADEIDADSLYPHALRATSATFLAGKGLPVLALQGLMGWKSPQTAEVYVQKSPENTARALHSVHSR